MIIIKLIGGLGNQMFQYAAGRRLAEINGANLKLDIGAFKNYALRKYELGVFNICEQFATKREIDLLTLERSGIINKAVDRLIKRQAKRKASYITENQPHFDPEILTLPDNVYLDGYWQSEKYFIDIEDTIRKEFTIKIVQDSKNKKTAEHIIDSESVSIHVRRGDYVSNEVTRQHHGTCPIEYYHAAIDIIAKKIKDPHFFVFSDEPEWSREKLVLDYSATYVAHNNEENSYEDLRLISLCNHHIIANSTFSWWGAWLSPYPEKIVIAPRKWFNREDRDIKDLFPQKWVII